MRKQIIESAALGVAEQVRTVEDRIDSALAEIAELQGRLLRVVSVAGIGVRTGHEAFEHLASTNSALISARGNIGNCHAAMVVAKDFVPGLRTVGFGDLVECPPSKAELRIVA